MTKDEKKELMILACKVRMGVIEGTHAAKSGHPAEVFPLQMCTHICISRK